MSKEIKREESLTLLGVSCFSLALASWALCTIRSVQDARIHEPFLTLSHPPISQAEYDDFVCAHSAYAIVWTLWYVLRPRPVYLAENIRFQEREKARGLRKQISDDLRRHTSQRDSSSSLLSYSLHGRCDGASCRVFGGNRRRDRPQSCFRRSTHKHQRIQLDR